MRVPSTYVCTFVDVHTFTTDRHTRRVVLFDTHFTFCFNFFYLCILYLFFIRFCFDYFNSIPTNRPYRFDSALPTVIAQRSRRPLTDIVDGSIMTSYLYARILSNDNWSIGLVLAATLVVVVLLTLHVKHIDVDTNV